MILLLSHKIILLAFAIAIGVIVWGVLEKGFWIPEIAAVFLAVGVISGILGKLSPDEMANAFIEGAKEMIGPAIMIGFAKRNNRNSRKRKYNRHYFIQFI